MEQFIINTKEFFIYLESSVFQPFSIRRTSWKFLITLWNLNVPYSTIFSIFREPRKELAEPLGSAEPRLKNTDLDKRSEVIVDYRVIFDHFRGEHHFFGCAPFGYLYFISFQLNEPGLIGCRNRSWHSFDTISI